MKKLFLLGSLILLGFGCQPIQKISQVPFPAGGEEHVYCSPDGEVVTTGPLKQLERSYCLVSKTQKIYTANEPATYQFHILDDRGDILKNFDTVHEKMLHVIVVRKDLNEFQHVHPEFDATTGEFTLSNIIFPSDGTYKIYTDFTPKDSNPTTLSETVIVGDDGSKNSVAKLTLTSSPQNVEKFVVSLKNLEQKETFMSGQEIKLIFHVDGKNNAPIEHVDTYLGAKGHLVILKEGSLAYLHVHPEEKKLTATYNDIPFFVTFPEAGKYKLFLEFQYGGKVYHVPYIIEVGQGQLAPISSGEHSMH